MTTETLTVEQIASITHEANRRYQLIINEPVAPKWEKASDSQRQSVMNGVQNAIDHPALTPQDSHENWLKFKRAEGYVWGATKDEHAKTHPCLLEYADLPARDKVKDLLFLTIVRVFTSG